MSKFFVGQRVRIVRADLSVECIGREGRVIGSPRPCSNLEIGYWEGVPTDVDGIGHISPRGGPYVFKSDYLEPILPEGAVKGEFTFQQLMDELKRIEA